MKDVLISFIKKFIDNEETISLDQAFTFSITPIIKSEIHPIPSGI